MKILIIIRIEAGFGDVNWGLRLLENLKNSYEVTLVFINCMNKQEMYLSQHSKYKLKFVTTKEIPALTDTVLLCKEKIIENEEIILHFKVFHKILNFHINLKKPLVHSQVINFDEYGKHTKEVRILFRDYKKDYFLEDSELFFIKNDEKTFSEKFNLTEKEFNKEKIRSLASKSFYFSYFSNLSLIHEVITFFYFLKKLGDFSDCEEFRVLTNYNFKGLVSNESFENVTEILQREVKSQGFSDNYYKLYYIKEMGNFNIRSSSSSDIVIQYNNKVMHILSYSVLTKYEYDYLLLKSKEIVGCTGDMSVSETISTNRLFIYQTLSHKLNFRKLLNEAFNKFHGEDSDSLLEFMFDPCLIRHSVKITDYKKFTEKWREFCLNYLRINCFMSWLNDKLEN